MGRIGLRAKFILVSLILLVLIFGSLTALLIRSNTTALRKSLREEAQSFGALATQPIGQAFELYKDSGRIKIQQEVENYLKLDSVISNVTIYDVDGVSQFSQRDPAPTITKAQAASFEPIYLLHPQGGDDVLVYPFIESFGGHRYTFVYSISNAIIDQSVRSAIISTILFGVSALAFTAFILFLAINRYFLAPIHSLSERALAISAGQLDLQIKLARQDEIGDLAASVDKMANSLKADIQKLEAVDKLKSEFMMISSHNLRTPLTVIIGYLDALNGMDLNPEVKKIVQNVQASGQQLNTLTEDILTVSQIEAGEKITMDFQPFETDAFLEDLAKQANTFANNKGIQFRAHINTRGALIKGNRVYLRHALWNMIDNAIKFTNQQGSVSLMARKEGQTLTVDISDSGIGIAETEIPKLFTKFHRGTSTMTYNYEGAGIGLYVSRLIVRQHGGEILVKSQIGRGSTFTVTLPLQP